MQCSAARRGAIVALAAGTLVVAGTLYGLDASSAQAHGKEVEIDLGCAPLDPGTPLDQSCEAVVTYANDGEPVTDARLRLEGIRPGKGDRVTGDPVKPSGEPGHYSGTISLSAYGGWLLSATMEAPAEGIVEFAQEVLPPSGAASPITDARARLLISFNTRDLANIGALIAHLVGTAAVFGVTAAVLITGLVAHGLRGTQYRRNVARAFPLLAVASFALIAGSGLYNAAYNSPTRSPGLFHPGAVADLPYGDAYVIAFAVKMALDVALLLGTAALAFQLRRRPSWLIPPVSGGSEAAFGEISGGPSLLAEARRDACISLAAFNLLIGGAVMINVIVLDYLHLLSHTGAVSGD
jgi:hypothetical protein